MSFHLRIGLSGLEGQPNKRVVLLGDTVQITDNGAVLLTKSIHRKYGHVSYSLGEEEEEEKQPSRKEKSKPQENAEQSDESDYEEVEEEEGVIKATRLRQKHNEVKSDDKNRNLHQAELLEAKLTELKRRLENEEIKEIQSKSKVKDMGRIRSYPNPE